EGPAEHGRALLGDRLRALVDLRLRLPLVGGERLQRLLLHARQRAARRRGGRVGDLLHAVADALLLLADLLQVGDELEEHLLLPLLARLRVVRRVLRGLGERLRRLVERLLGLLALAPGLAGLALGEARLRPAHRVLRPLERRRRLRRRALRVVALRLERRGGL